MSNASLNRICNDENDPMLHLTMRCKHGDLMQLQTSWSEDNPARRFWSCPRFRENSCKYFRWRDLEEIDMRSKSVIPRLANRIKELEEALQFYKSKEKMKLLEKKGDQVCHDKLIKKKKKMKCSILNWKLIIVLVAVFFLILGINKNVNAEKCSCMPLELP
ncbi:hypothetical protein MTR67_036868 [Solanum verrucosum]|uniref:GRF-type domain-containing protein n=1 Tax=Solanum verrucosum TaxID=315347 RepID=A0AAF0UCU6_SOLVR|nr:hypothetical protein MTR67_036868 [Solanum verrucosum]